VSLDQVTSASRRTWTAIAAMMALAGLASSQGSVTPPPGDPLVFYTYLRQAHRAVSELTKGTSGSTPAAVAARLHVKVGNLSAVARVYLDTAGSLEPLDAEGRAYVQQGARNGHPRDMAKLGEFDQRRMRFLERAKVRLHDALGETEWLQLLAYIDGEFRMHVKRRGV
jgi:hypothetical protein